MSDWDRGEPAESFDIAIIGMAGRFPGADDLAAFWRNLREGVESITFFSDQQLAALGVSPAAIGSPNYVKAAPVLKDADRFDAAFFGYAPREAEVLDPQHRVFLECAWEVFERAGYNPETYDGLIGVYAGMSLGSYLLFNLLGHPQLSDEDTFQAMIGNDKDFLSTRTSYELNLRGPSINVQTGCSTALVAVHLACQSLLSYQCDLALAGGVSVNVPQRTGYYYQEGGITSPDGHCRAFDARAQGTLFGSGVGVVVLKRLDDALKDGDTIYALIKGSAVNNDGGLKIGYTAPSVDGQAEVIASAQAVAGVAAETIGYIEAHGTATALGDPVEVAAATRVFRASTDKSGFCAIGTVKTNIGHLDAAAGVAGLIKTVLALQHRQIPPSLHYEQPNPKIDFANSPFYVNTKLLEWPAGPTPRRAGVSSFGIGGTNAHLILEEAPVAEESGAGRPWQLLLLSAKTSSALEAATTNLAAQLREQSDLNLADAAYTLQVGRKAFEHRRMLVCRDRADAEQALESADPQRVFTAYQEPVHRPVVFMFPGGGAQYVHMGHELYQVEPVFREHVDRCAELLRPRLGLDLREVLYPDQRPTTDDRRPTTDDRRPTTDDGTGTIDRVPTTDYRRPTTDHRPPTSDPARPLTPSPLHPFTPSPAHPPSPIPHPPSPIPQSLALRQTALGLPALFVVEYALAQLWISWGVRPAAMIGHSLGEYVAACLSGVLSLEDALALVVLRGRLFEQLPSGAMLSIPLPEDDVRAMIDGTLSIAAINAPAQCVVSGPAPAIEALAVALAERALDFRRIQIDVAAHSVMVEPILRTFRAFVETLELHPPAIPYISNVTGTWMTAQDATDPGYWVRHLRQTVRFSIGLRELLDDPSRLLLEVGPGRTLSTLAKLHVADVRAQPVLSSIRHPYDRQPDSAFLLTALGKLWLAGASVDWAGMYAHERRRRIPLPTYPFERQRYWLAPPAATDRDTRQQTGKKPEIADWFYIPSWKRSMLPKQVEPGAHAHRQRRWLVLSDECGVGTDLVQRLKRAGHDVTSVLAGERFARLGDQVYMIDPRRRDQYGALLEELRGLDKRPDVIVHGWSVTAGDWGLGIGECALDDAARDHLRSAQEVGFYSLLYLAQALGEHDLADPLQLWVIASAVQQVESADVIAPEKATLIGPCRVIPQEYENITCRLIDIVVPAVGTARQQLLGEQLLAELTAESPDLAVAYRGAHRWVQTYDAVRLEGVPAEMSGLRERGVYLITGGLGGVGMVFAEYLARTVRARLILTGRAALPAEEEWDRLLAVADEQDNLARKIRGVRALEALGAEVLAMSADVADYDRMRAVIAATEERFGPINGVIHAAGDPGGGVIQLKTPDMCAAVLAPKVDGTLVLDAVLRGARLDFLVLCSSLNVILSEVGQVDYCAANAFLDAFAHARAAGGAPVVTVDWNRWQQIGMAVAVETMHRTITGRELAAGMTAHEGIEAFRRILLRNSFPQIVVSTDDLPALIEQHNAFKLSSSLEELAAARLSQSAHPRPALATAYVVPGNQVERTIAAIWQELLGIDQLGVHDNFFDLGGNSLIGLKVIARLKKELNVDVSVVSLFEGPTVGALARLIEQQNDAPDYDESYSRGEKRREKRLRKLRAVKEGELAG